MTLAPTCPPPPPPDSILPHSVHPGPEFHEEAAAPRVQKAAVKRHSVGVGDGVCIPGHSTASPHPEHLLRASSPGDVGSTASAPHPGAPGHTTDAPSGGWAPSGHASGWLPSLWGCLAGSSAPHSPALGDQAPERAVGFRESSTDTRTGPFRA